MDSFAGKVALVTGATRGIGRAAAIAFAREGAHVVFCGRHEEWGEETANLARQTGGEATFVRADVTIEAEVEAFVQKAVSSTWRRQPRGLVRYLYARSWMWTSEN